VDLDFAMAKFLAVGAAMFGAVVGDQVCCQCTGCNDMPCQKGPDKVDTVTFYANGQDDCNAFCKTVDKNWPTGAPEKKVSDRPYFMGEGPNQAGSCPDSPGFACILCQDLPNDKRSVCVAGNVPPPDSTCRGATDLLEESLVI